MIGVTEERGANEAIEAAIRAPTRGGMDKEARRERAQALIDACEHLGILQTLVAVR